MKLSIIIIFMLSFAFTGCMLFESDQHVHYHFCPEKPYKIYYRPIYVNGKPLNGGYAMPPKEYPQYYYRIRVYNDGRTELDSKQYRPYRKPLTFRSGWYVK